MIPKVLFVGGKGGVGKTSVSSALATILSEQKNILLISTDPAHNLSDIFGMKFSSEITQININLSVIEIDPEYEAKNYVQKVAKSTRSFVGTESYGRIDDYFDKVANTSSALEAALFERLSIILSTKLNEFDHIIIDTAPTGHTLRLFFMPGQLRDWAKNLLSMQERGGMAEKVLGHLSNDKDNRFSDPDGFVRSQLIQLLDERYERYSAFSNLVKDNLRCGIILVLNANKLAVNETQRSIINLKEKGLSPYAIILNKILPQSSDDDFMHSRIIQESEYIKLSDENFKKFKYIKVPLLSKDVTGIEMLKEFGKQLLKELISAN